MAKRINKKKQRQRILILIAVALILLILIISLFVFLIKLLFKKPETKAEVKEQTVEKLTLKTPEEYAQYGVDESGNVPVMMYHGIYSDIASADTEYVGGNVDYDGYQRTGEAFRGDLDFYYQNGYRMVRLTDYVDGNIDVEGGKSPLILTFDDGLQNNISVTGLDENGEIILDPGCAVAIMEEYKEKYPDFNVTATFFVEGQLFRQPDYDAQILQWLVEHGYDVGNHTYSHPDFTEIDTATASSEVGIVYNLLDDIIPGKYVNIVALPFGSPYEYDHPNMPYIYDSEFNGKSFHTKASLRVGWEADYSPFSDYFTPNFIKRIRAYDNNGENFDIQMNFDILNSNRYISDGDPNTIVVPEGNKDIVTQTYGKQVITY